MMAAPVRDSPVNVTALIPGWLTRCSPAEPSPNPCTRLKTPLRHAGIAHHLCQQRGACRSLFRRLHYHGIAARQSWRHLPRQQQERKVPRRDDSDYADGLAHGVVQRLLAVGSLGLKRFERSSLDQVGKNAKVRCGARNVQPRSQRDGLAGIRRLGPNEFVEPRLDAFGNLVQQSRALPHSPAAPFALQRPARGLDRGIDDLRPASATRAIRVPSAGLMSSNSRSLETNSPSTKFFSSGMGAAEEFRCWFRHYSILYRHNSWNSNLLDAVSLARSRRWWTRKATGRTRPNTQSRARRIRRLVAS